MPTSKRQSPATSFIKIVGDPKYFARHDTSERREARNPGELLGHPPDSTCPRKPGGNDRRFNSGGCNWLPCQQVPFYLLKASRPGSKGPEPTPRYSVFRRVPCTLR